MKSMEEIAQENIQITEEQKAYDDIIAVLLEAKENNTPIEEGLGKALLGGLAGVTVGPAIMKAVCKVLGINEGGALGNLMTSRLVLTAMGGYLGWKN
jgi:outer membrane lipoprotein SlyB